MRYLIICAFIMLFAVKVYAIGQSEDKDAFLPSNAYIIEVQPLNPERALVLWMINPQIHPRRPDETDYDCLDFTRGHHYSGPTRVSLLNVKDGTVINTLEIKLYGKDSFDIPYKIEAGLYYHVE